MSRLLQVEQVSFAFNGANVLDDVSFALEAGECAALIGPNGAGKSTLLRLIAGLLRCSAGNILLNGAAVSGLSHREIARAIALVPQDIEIPFDFSVEQIVEQGRTPYLRFFGGPTRKDRQAVARAMDMASVTSLAHRAFNELSGGERQRVKIALGLAQEPKLLLLDEPTQNLDIGRQVELLDLVVFLRDQGITILSAMHELQLIPGTFPSVLLLTPEHTLLKGSPAEILQAAILEHSFDCPPQRHPVLMRDVREEPV